MVDSVYLTSRQFNISDSKKQLHTILDIMPTGEVTERQYYNFTDKRKKEQLEKAGMPEQGSITIKRLGGTPLLCFSVSLPKLLHGHSMDEVTPADLDRCIDGIGQQLSYAGIDYSRKEIAGMTVSRIDYCKNIKVDGHLPEYLYMIDKCRLPYAEYTPQPAGTALFKNKSWQFTAYDKVKDVVDDVKQRMAARLTRNAPHNVLRFEYRLLNGAAVKRVLGSNSNRHVTFAQCYDRETSKRLLLNKFDLLQMDAEVNAVMNSSSLADLFAGRDHAAVKNSIAIPFILAAVNYDMDLLRSYLQPRYSVRQLRNIMNEYRAFMYEKYIPKHRDMFHEMRSKLAA